MGLVIQGVLIGTIATIGMDIWAAVVKYVFRLPTADWAMVGRWFGHMPRGTFAHHPISDTAPIPNELVIGWIAHYITGLVYGLAYLYIVQVLLTSGPSLISALVFGLVRWERLGSSCSRVWGREFLLPGLHVQVSCGLSTFQCTRYLGFHFILAGS